MKPEFINLCLLLASERWDEVSGTFNYISSQCSKTLDLKAELISNREKQQVKKLFEKLESLAIGCLNL